MPVSKGGRKRKGKKRHRNPNSCQDDEEFFSDTIIPGAMLGFEKMSEVLIEFARPYACLATSEAGYHKLYTLASLAWNAALVPPADREQKLDELFEKAGAALSQESRLIILDLIDRKERYFAKYTRAIMNYHLEVLPEGVHVTVLSTVAKPERSSRFRQLREWLGR